MKLFTSADVTETNHIYADHADLVVAPLAWQSAGLQQTASGYGVKYWVS